MATDLGERSSVEAILSLLNSSDRRGFFMVASAIPLVEENFATNEAHRGLTLLSTGTLDWDVPIASCTCLKDLTTLDLVLCVNYKSNKKYALTPIPIRPCRMADVTYNQDAFPALLRTLIDLLRSLGGPAPAMVLMGYKERDPKERGLWDLAREAGLELEQVGELIGGGDRGVEIWIGGLNQGCKGI